MLNSRKYTTLAVLGVGLAVAAATPAKAHWYGWGGPYYGYGGFHRVGYWCGCPRAYAAYFPRYRFYRPYAYAAYFPRYRFYRPVYAWHRPMYRFYRPAYAWYRPMYRFYRPVYAYGGYFPRFRFYRAARFW